MDVKEIINKIIKEIVDDEFDEDEALISTHSVDSMDMVEIVIAMEERFSIEIDGEELTLDNFDTVRKMIAFVSQKLPELKGKRIFQFDKEDISIAFNNVGISKGDTVLVFSNLGRIGKIKDTKSKFDALNTYLGALLETVDASQGTIVVPTFTYTYARGKAFDYEDSPSELCMFSEFVRTQKDSFRSFHPHFSCAAIGKDKLEICDNISRSSFGYESVFDRLHKRNAKILFLGTNITEGLTFFLYIEHMVGISHCYHKAYFVPAYKNKQLIKGPFFSFVRHLEPGLNSDLFPFETHLKEVNLVKESKLGSGNIQLVNCVDVFNEGYKKIQESPCYFYKNDFFITA